MPDTAVLDPKLAEKTQQLLKYALSFGAFCREVLGYTDMIQDHDDLCAFLQNPAQRFKLVLMPRYSYKSCIATYGYSLWRLMRQDSLRILIYSHSNRKAEGFLSEIKNHILGMKESSIFRQVYGPWESDPKRGVWNQAAITISVRQNAQAEPSVDTAGLETGKVGTHYDLIIFDDIVAPENVTTPELMQKTKDIYRGALSLLKPGGDVLVVGTRWNFNDLYGELTEQPHYQTFLRKSEVDGEYPFARIGLTPEFLAQQKSDQGSHLWSCLYQNEPVSEEDAIFQESHFTTYDPALRFQPDFLASLFITCCLDPATGEGEDLAALTVVGADPELNLYLLEVVSGKLSTSDQIEAALQLHRHWHFSVFGIERNGFQQMVRRDLDYRIAQERASNRDFRLFTIEEFTSSSQNSKDMRIRGLQPYHERGAIRFPCHKLHELKGSWERLIYQMRVYTPSHHPAHEDELDSLSFHPHITRRGFTTQPKETAPFSSAKWFEQRQAEKFRGEQARRPRWAREPVPQLAFN